MSALPMNMVVHALFSSVKNKKGTKCILLCRFCNKPVRHYGSCLLIQFGDHAFMNKPAKSFHLLQHGYCPICQAPVDFESHDAWLRDHYQCTACHSIPRERALMTILDQVKPNWRALNIHESSPSDYRGLSLKLKTEAGQYIASHYYPQVATGTMHHGYRCEDIENLTFADNSIDIHVTQDVMEHIFDAKRAFREIARTLKPGGIHIFAVPIERKFEPTLLCAERGALGNITHHTKPEYHGNPIDAQGCLVVRKWGYDIMDFIYRASGLTTCNYQIRDTKQGIDAAMIDIFVTAKPAASAKPKRFGFF